MLEAVYLYKGEAIKATMQGIQTGIYELCGEFLYNERFYGGIQFVTIVAERFFFRISSTAGLVLTLCIADNEISVYAAVNGAGEGLTNWGYGSYQKLLNMAEGVLLPLGFQKKNA